MNKHQTSPSPKSKTKTSVGSGSVLISQGAEAKIYLDEDMIIKSRIPKSYRHEKLDNQIRTRRTKSEAKILEKARTLKINVPKMHYISKEINAIYLEYIQGERLSETLNSKPEKIQFEIMQKIGQQTAKLHNNNIIHGDLTTSNTILQKKTNKVFIIDFGLGFISQRIEDKAVDLHLIKQALEAKHFQNNKDLYNNFLKGYKKIKFEKSKASDNKSANKVRQSWDGRAGSEQDKILEQLKKVEARGRYKH